MNETRDHSLVFPCEKNMHRKKLVYGGAGAAIAVVVFIAGLLIGRFAIPRPPYIFPTDDGTRDTKEAEEDPTIVHHRFRQQLLDTISAQEIEVNLR